ncbi:cytochrome d ubiquinol oxidase subunit II [Streptomyces globisporus]|uniref:cytochrome d ubiquinol oxidase subunit II n=1 Tax=Streptomyces globisporus TaxID=1908 RepID=UPI00366777F5
MDVFWYSLVGVLLAGYLALESIDFGVGMLLPFSGDEASRARMRRLVVPLFLANEVWLVACVGLLFGALPVLEGALLQALRLPVLALVCAWLLRDAALWFRQAHPGSGWRRVWDTVLPVSSLVLAAGWGAVLGAMVRGLSTRAGGHPVVDPIDLVHPLPLVCAASAVAACLCQGALFAARGLPTDGPAARRAARLNRVASPVVLGLLVLVGGVAAAVVDAPARVAAVAGGAGLCVAGSILLARAGRATPALVLGSAPLWALPLLVGVAHGTTVLATRSGAGDLTLGEAVADGESLWLLSVTVLPVLVAVVAVQWWFWRVFARVRSAVAAA